MCPDSAQNDPAAGPGLVRIGELSRRSGVGVETLRAWERRYGVLAPTRSTGGFRLYSAGDQEAARAMRALIDGGLSAAQAAEAVRGGAGRAPHPSGESAIAPGATADRLVAALVGLDEEAANRILDEALGALSFDAAAQGVFLPALRAIGEGWVSGEVSVGQEHFASNLLRGRLLGLARGWMTGIGPVAVLACPPGENHDLGLIVFGLSLRGRGWRIAFLGTDTPLDTIAQTADSLGASLVVLHALDPAAVESAEGELRELSRGRPLAVAGAAADSDALAELDVTRLSQGPVEEAARIAREVAPRP